MSQSSIACLFALACIVLPAMGCNSQKLNKVIVEGSVSYGGEPIKNGEIRFYPMEGTEGPVSGAPIVDGHYRAVAKGGVPVGKHAVKVIAYKVTNSGVDDDMIAAAESNSGRTNYIPSKYNETTELTLDVSGDTNNMTLDFELAK